MVETKLTITHLSDYYGDCEQCGGGAGAEGYRVHKDGELLFELTPVDHCYSPTTFDELDLLRETLKHFGHEVEIEDGGYEEAECAE